MRRVLFLTTLLFCCIGAPAWADGPGVGTQAIVALGDSAISGEAGRWAGNTNSSSSKVDALGSSAYWDAGNAEAIRGCHRSKAAEVHIGGGFRTANLACSGARTYTNAGGSDFKPGIDFYSDSSGRVGQALALQRYAAANNVRAVDLADRRQQLRVRRHRAGVRDQLADLAVVVAELLQRRLGHPVAVHG